MSSSKPRVLHIITRLDPGGSATNTLKSVERLREHGFDTALAYGVTDDPGGSLKARLLKIGVPVFFLRHLVRDISPRHDLLAIKDIKKLLRQEHFDLVHSHTSKAGVFGRMAARACRLPAVHTPHGHIFYGYFGPALTNIFVMVERRMARHTARIISLTDTETRESLENGIGRREQYITIHSGVPLSDFRRIPVETGAGFRARVGIPADAFLFVSAGRLVQVKGFDLLLRGFAGSDFGQRQVFLAIAGDGEQRKMLETMAGDLGISARLRFAGELPDIRALLSAGNTFILASRNEGMGRVFVEAMAAELPVIGTAVGGIPTLIKDGVTGLLVPPEMPDAMARAMERIVSDNDLRVRLGRQSSEAVYPEYDEGTMIEKLAMVYREVLEDAGK